jgi:hypothetical protein
LGVAATLIFLKFDYLMPAEVVKKGDLAVLTDAEAREALPILAHCELMKNPETYSGKIVRVNMILYWNMHGYFSMDENCAGQDEEAFLGIEFNPENLEALTMKIDEITGSKPYDFRNVINIIVVGKFEKVEKCTFCSDAMIDRTRLHFEMIEIEKGVNDFRDFTMPGSKNVQRN